MTHLSADLLPIYELELRLGNQVSHVYDPWGSECPLAISFRDPLHFDVIAKQLTLAESVMRWRNDDTHYPLESGYVSKVSRHSIAGPHPSPSLPSVEDRALPVKPAEKNK
jgi:hypothetical protein